MPNSNKIVMLIDDNAIDLKINSKIINLTQQIDKVISCISGDEALDYIKKNIGNETKLPTLILLDIQMPEMDGFEFLEHYKKLPSSFTETCQIAMLSSTLDFGDTKKAEANPHVIKLLKKPLLPKELSLLLI